MKYKIMRQPGGFARISDDFSGLNFNNATGILTKVSPVAPRSVTSTRPTSSPAISVRPAPTGTIPHAPALPYIAPVTNPVTPMPSDTIQPIPTGGGSAPIGGGGGGGGGSEASPSSEASTEKGSGAGGGGGVLRKSCVPHYVLAAVIGGLGGNYAARHYKKNVWGGTLIGAAVLAGGMIWWCYKHHNDTPAPVAQKTT